VIKWKAQSTWPAGHILHILALDWVERIRRASGGRLDIKMASAGEIVPAFECYDAVTTGVLDASHSWAGYWIGKYEALTFFAAMPAFIDPVGYAIWLQEGGGKELWQEVCGDEVVVLPLTLAITTGETGGWANKPIQSLKDFEGLKYRTVLIWGEILSDLGAAVVTLPGGEIVPSLERGTLDAAEFSDPKSDWDLGFPDVAKYHFYPGIWQVANPHEVLVNPESWKALPDDLKAIVELASQAGFSTDCMKRDMESAKHYKKITELPGVTIMTFPPEMQKEIMDRFWQKYEEHAVKDPMFGKCWESFKDFLSLYKPYRDIQTPELK